VTRWKVAALLAVPALLLAGAGPGTAWESLSSGFITVEHAPEDELAARRVLEIASEAAPRLHRDMGVEPAPIRLQIAPDETAFRDMTSGSVPEWGVGVAYPSRALIVLRSPRIVEYPLALGQIVVHELAHVAAHRGLRGVRAPRWFHEGVAMMSAGEWRLGSLDAMVARIGGGGTIPLAELDTSFPYDTSDASAAYAESFFAVDYLAEVSGVGTAPGLVRAMGAAGSFDEGVRILTGGGQDEFERNAVAAMRRSFTLPLFLRTSDFLFLGLAVLLVVALVLRLRARRRQMAELAENRDEPPRWRPGSDSAWH